MADFPTDVSLILPQTGVSVLVTFFAAVGIIAWY